MKCSTFNSLYWQVSVWSYIKCVALEPGSEMFPREKLPCSCTSRKGSVFVMTVCFIFSACHHVSVDRGQALDLSYFAPLQNISLNFALLFPLMTWWTQNWAQFSGTAPSGNGGSCVKKSSQLGWDWSGRRVHQSDPSKPTAAKILGMEKL